MGKEEDGSQTLEEWEKEQKVTGKREREGSVWRRKGWKREEFEEGWQNIGARRGTTHELVYIYHSKNKLVVLTTEWLSWLQTSWRDSGNVLFICLHKTTRKEASQTVTDHASSKQVTPACINEHAIRTILLQIYIVTSARESPQKHHISEMQL